LCKDLDQRPEKNIATETLIRLAKLVLTKNCFEFNGRFYKQISGTMMGTPFGVEYANLFMANEERKIYDNYHDLTPEFH
jgi:hypothetical protein